MIFGWIIGLIAILVLVFVIISDVWAGKNSNYYQVVQKHKGKSMPLPEISTSSKHDKFYYKLNS